MSSERWQLSSNAATLYERYVHPLMVPWVEALVDTARIDEGESVLDVACGTGFVSRLAAEKVGQSGRVVGSDINTGMLVTASEIANAKGLTAIEWREADVINLPFDDESFEVVLCQQGMQFFPDSATAVKELHRVLKPEGRFGFTIWKPVEDNPYFDALANALETHVSEQAADGLRGAFAKSYSDHYESSLADARFKHVEIDSPVLDFRLPPLAEYLPGHLASLPMASEIAALPDTKKALILNDVGDSLEGFAQGDLLELPSQCELVRAIK